MLQCRVGKRNGVVAVRMATEMYASKLIDAPTAIKGYHPINWVELLFANDWSWSRTGIQAHGQSWLQPVRVVPSTSIFIQDDAVAWAMKGENR